MISILSSRLGRLFLIALLALLLAVILVLFFGSRILYANPFFQSWVKNQIASETQGEFQFGNIDGGFVSARLENLSLNLKGTAYNVRNVQSPEMKAAFAWQPLLQNRLEIRSLHMQGGELDMQLQGGQANQVVLPVSKSFRLSRGTVKIANFSGWQLELYECDLVANQSGADSTPVIHGSVTAKHGSIGGLRLEGVKGEFRLENGVLHVEKLKAVLPGESSLQFSGSLALEGKPLIDLKLSLDSPDIKTLLQAIDFSNKVAGRSKITLKAKGQFTSQTRSLSGDGKATFSRIDPDLPLPKLPAYNDAPILKRVQEIDDLEGAAKYLLAQSRIAVTDLSLKNKDVHITGTAQIGYDRTLSSQFLLTGDTTVAGEIPIIARNAFQYDKDGNVLIPFQLKPDTRDPQIDVGDLVNRVISKSLNPLNLLK